MIESLGSWSLIETKQQVVSVCDASKFLHAWQRAMDSIAPLFVQAVCVYVSNRKIVHTKEQKQISINSCRIFFFKTRKKNTKTNNK